MNQILNLYIEPSHTVHRDAHYLLVLFNKMFCDIEKIKKPKELTKNEQTDMKIIEHKEIEKPGIINTLSTDLLENIASYANMTNIINMISTCKQFYSCKDRIIPSILKNYADRELVDIFCQLLYHGNTNALQWFQEAGILSEFLQNRVNIRGFRTFRMLSTASHYGHKKLVGSLIAAGPDNDHEKVAHALYHASVEGKNGIFNSLTSAGAKVNIKRHRGYYAKNTQQAIASVKRRIQRLNT